MTQNWLHEVSVIHYRTCLCLYPLEIQATLTLSIRLSLDDLPFACIATLKLMTSWRGNYSSKGTCRDKHVRHGVEASWGQSLIETVIETRGGHIHTRTSEWLGRTPAENVAQTLHCTFVLIKPSKFPGLWQCMSNTRINTSHAILRAILLAFLLLCFILAQIPKEYAHIILHKCFCFCFFASFIEKDN